MKVVLGLLKWDGGAERLWEWGGGAGVYWREVLVLGLREGGGRAYRDAEEGTELRLEEGS